jgi:PAS domain-containing protein
VAADLVRVRNLLRLNLAEGGPPPYRCAARRRPGRRRAQGLPVNIGEEQKGYIAIYHDISAYKKAQAELSEQKTYLEAVVQHSPVAIIVINPDATVRAWNPGAEKLFGYTAQEAIGRDIDDLVATRRPRRGTPSRLER